MATTLKLRRGTTTQHATFTGALGEVTVDTDKDVVVVHDGSTAGGFPALRAGAGASVSSLTNSGNITFTGTGNRITGDFSNATVANRVAFQSSTVNGSTSITAIPNGTSVFTSFRAFNFSDPGNAAYIDIASGSTEMLLRADKNGTGTYLPMTFHTGGSERMRVDTSGNVGIGTSSPTSKLQVSNSTAVDTQIRASNSLSTLTLSSFGDGTSGIETTGAYAQRFFTNSAERMRIDSSGNVGIGTSSPSTFGKFVVRNTDGRFFAVADAGVPRFRYDDNSIQDMVFQNSGITAGGQGIGLQAQLGDSVANTGTAGYIRFLTEGTWSASSASKDAFLAFGTAQDGNVSERARINSNGEVSIGKVSASESAITGSGYGFGSPNNDPFFSVVNVNASGGNACAYFNRRTTGSVLVFMTNNGTTNSTVGSISHNGTSTAYNTSSDYRLKHDIAPMQNALATVAQLKPVTYKWNADNSESQGFIAHELAEVVPDAVTGEKDAVNEDGSIKPQGIDTSFLVATLTAGLQEAVAMIEELKAKVAALEEK